MIPLLLSAFAIRQLNIRQDVFPVLTEEGRDQSWQSLKKLTAINGPPSAIAGRIQEPAKFLRTMRE
jgi:hypothetical protein